ncbi:hypothetical protein FIBSPDRAFT_885024 [Athelia psychrophila]|uniref:Uncharacterized protein n=1 Tax=Athelia psychrophila TaxID=1759441 RepID=A0A166SB61_9AGAM|nr:hypothetical protein FIBSPDRAFT_885024 [Fibularhizoctonia sp. CBS 109695]
MACHVDKLGNTPYRAFYGLDSNRKDLHSWVPALPIPITLSAEYSLSMTAHVSSASTLILHFYLEGLKNRSLPPMDKHTANVNKWVDDVSIVVFITTHAHDETGDLYGGPGFSSDPYDVLNGLFPKSLRRAFKDRSVYLNFLVCGGFAETLSSRMALFKAARRLHAHEAIAFSSPGLIPSLTNGFWLDFAFRVMIEGASLGHALPYMLSATSTSQFVRHTNLLYVKIPDSNTEPGRTIKGNQCDHELSVQPMDGFKAFGIPQDGARWMVKTDRSVILELGRDTAAS